MAATSPMSRPCGALGRDIADLAQTSRAPDPGWEAGTRRW
jgi:hypothetical protein